ncbi:hypothetical protein ACRARG_01535 [Pseudooceanicola sp. C21-150M6]|uniref:COG3904 family protein n=1 Tax=Pseudooceanicola sp. C21-150M6 TaxID=3434355 RepID=UPI003D7F44DB
MISDAEKLKPIRRTLGWVLGFQLVLGAVLFLGDIGRDFSWPSSGPKAPRFETPVSPGDQTRRYEPTLPAAPGIETTGPMPTRMVLTTDDEGGRLLTGRIQPGDGARIARELAAGGAEPVRLHSPGGSVSDALEIGRAIRTKGIATRMGAEDVCLSACPYVFAGGVERSAAEGARLGVHQHYYGENTLLPAFLAVQDIQRGQGEVMRYLDQMGVDPMLLSHGMATPPDAIYILSAEELGEYGLVTE